MKYAIMIVAKGNKKAPLRRLNQIKETTMSVAQCTVNWCTNEQADKYKSEYCSPHYWRAREGRDMDSPISENRRGMTAYERVMCQTKVVGDCLEFTGIKRKSGYATVSELGGKKKSLVHRVVAEHHLGKSDLYVLHSCDNPSCVKIEHLRYGTQKDNMADAMERNRTTRGTKNSQAILTPEQVLEIYNTKDSQLNLSKKFGCSVKNITNIKQGVSWSWLTKT